MPPVALLGNVSNANWRFKDLRSMAYEITSGHR